MLSPKCCTNVPFCHFRNFIVLCILTRLQKTKCKLCRQVFHTVKWVFDRCFDVCLCARCAYFSRKFLQPGEISFDKIHFSIMSLSERITQKLICMVTEVICMLSLTGACAPARWDLSICSITPNVLTNSQSSYYLHYMKDNQTLRSKL